jgi:hypothetical protein
VPPLPAPTAVEAPLRELPHLDFELIEA